jgi:hypothetical protein
VQVCAEFLALRIPRNVEIFDEAAELQTAELQTGGYRRLVHPYIYPQLLHLHLHLLHLHLLHLHMLHLHLHMQVHMHVRIHVNLHLHQHLFTRAVGGLMSTELREESYNVVITAGGFDSDTINPLGVSEMLQLLRPEGYLLWTMRTVQCSAV